MNHLSLEVQKYNNKLSNNCIKIPKSKIKRKGYHEKLSNTTNLTTTLKKT